MQSKQSRRTNLHSQTSTSRIQSRHVWRDLSVCLAHTGCCLFVFRWRLFRFSVVPLLKLHFLRLFTFKITKTVQECSHDHLQMVVPASKRKRGKGNLFVQSAHGVPALPCSSPQQEFLPFSLWSAFPGRRLSKENCRKSWYRQFYGRLTQMLRTEDAGAGNGFISLLWGLKK